MFTPIGFYAPTDGLPAIIKDFAWFYDASKGALWVDQSGNGNDGTEEDATGVASITHTSGDKPYWEFATTDGATNNPYIDVGLAPGAQSDITLFALFQDRDLSVNGTFIWAFDASLDQVTLGTSRNSDTLFSNIRGDKRIDNNSTGPMLSEDTWYMGVSRQSVSGDTSTLLLNNIELPLLVHHDAGEGGNINVSADYNIGRGQLVATQANRFKIGAVGVAHRRLSDAELTELYDYYNEIYNLPQPSIPPLLSEASVFYSANQNTDWADLSGNGNDGTVGTLGSGGGAAIDHVAGATPYWQFKAPNPLTEQKFLDTNYAKTVSGDYSVILVISLSDVTTNNIQGVGGLATPSGNASFNIGQNTTQRFYHGNKGANAADDLFAYGDTILSTDTFYMVTVVGDSSGIYLYNNNTLDGSDTSNGVTYASSETFVLGRDISLTANYVNNQKVAAYAFFDGTALDATQRTELFDYYNAIYSF